jgi:hypothetical protein
MAVVRGLGFLWTTHERECRQYQERRKEGIHFFDDILAGSFTAGQPKKAILARSGEVERFSKRQCPTVHIISFVIAA